MHLSPEELVDVAEGTTAPAAVAHLAECAVCCAQVEELRQMMARLAVDVPEPSPLFWEHLSLRVHDAVAAERVPARRWSWLRMRPLSWGLAAAAVLVATAATLTLRQAPAPAGREGSMVIAEAPVADSGSAASADDPSFVLLGDLAGNLDWDAAAEAGISMDVGASDRALAELTDPERVELQRLLREEMKL